MVKNTYVPTRFCKAHDNTLFGDTLYKTVSKHVRRMAGKFYSILSDEDIDDLVHDVFLKLKEKESKANLDLNFDGWVFRTCQNAVKSCALAKSRRNGWIVDLDEDYDDDDHRCALDCSSVLADETFKADRDTLEKESEQRFWKAVGRLTPENREVAQMLMDETPYSEMAIILGCSESTLRVRIYRTRKALYRMGIAV